MSRRIPVSGGPCQECYVAAGGLSGRPPRALWAVRDADGDVGCISGEPGHPPELDTGECLLGCYEYDEATDHYTWRPSALGPGHRRFGRPGVCADDFASPS